MSETAGMTAAALMQGAGAGYSAMGSLQAGSYQRSVADYNAAVAEYQAQDAITRGAEAERRHRAGTRGLIGAGRASSGAQGQDLNDPDSSAMDIQLEAAYMGELDALTLRNNAAREAWGYKVNAQNSRVQGQIAYADARGKAVGTILTTSADYALKKYGFPKDPPPTRGSYSRSLSGSFTDPYRGIG